MRNSSKAKDTARAISQFLGVALPSEPKVDMTEGALLDNGHDACTCDYSLISNALCLESSCFALGF